MSQSNSLRAKLGYLVEQRNDGQPYPFDARGHLYSLAVAGPKATLEDQAELCFRVDESALGGLVVDQIMHALRVGHAFPGQAKLVLRGDRHRACLRCGEPWFVAFDGVTFAAAEPCLYRDPPLDITLALPSGRLVVTGSALHMGLDHGMDLEVAFRSLRGRGDLSRCLAGFHLAVAFTGGNSTARLFANRGGSYACLAQEAPQPGLSRFAQVSTDAAVFTLIDEVYLAARGLHQSRQDLSVHLQRGLYRVRFHLYRADWHEHSQADPTSPLIEIDRLRAL